MRIRRIAASILDRFAGDARRGRIYGGRDDLPAHPVSRMVREQGWTYLSYRKLNALMYCMIDVERRGVAGQVIEAGCALGGSSAVVAAVKSMDRPMRLYDVFGMIPQPTDEDGPDVHARYREIASGEATGLKGGQYYGYRDDLQDEVRENLARSGIDLKVCHVEMVRGLLQETLHTTDPVALAHIDVDWHDPVKVCLERIGENLSCGGYMILDDYFAWSGCRKATDDYLMARKGMFEIDTGAGSMILRRLTT